MTRTAMALATLTLLSSASFAETCDTIRAQIDAKVRAAGVQQFTLTTVDAGAKVAGKVVGSCDLGTKQIVYSQGPAAGSAAPTAAAGSTGTPTPATARAAPTPTPKKAQQPILTECRDGTVSMGGDCKK
jgi:Protein of unknown function (DUF1161)